MKQLCNQVLCASAALELEHSVYANQSEQAFQLRTDNPADSDYALIEYDVQNDMLFHFRLDHGELRNALRGSSQEDIIYN